MGDFEMRGFTLIELVVALAVIGLALFIVVSVLTG
jgi:prepilin-type N-terminal cleavage/methylation domain-containing protein